MFMGQKGGKPPLGKGPRRSSQTRPHSFSWPWTGCGSKFRQGHCVEVPKEPIGDAEPILQRFHGGAQLIEISFQPRL